jgi:hypothetical protein
MECWMLPYSPLKEKLKEHALTYSFVSNIK